MLNQKTIHPYLYAGMSNSIRFNNEISNEVLLEIICDAFYVKSSVIMNTISCRKRELVTVRQIYFYFKKRNSKESLSSIASFFQQDHATVLHAIKTVNNLIDTDKDYRLRINRINFKIKKESVRIEHRKTEKIMNRIKQK